MKRTFLLCAAISAALILGSCANRNSSATASNTIARQGLVDAGSVAPVSGGPAGPRAPKQRFQP